MIVKKIWCKDFLSFESLEYEVPQHPVRIQGVNKTDLNQESNGSGKSGLQNIFEYAVLSSNSRKERDKGLIRIGTTEGEVGITIECSVRQQELEIVRVLKKSGSKLGLKINGEEVMFSTVRDGNEFILDWLKMTKEDIQLYYIINSERFKSFFHNSNKEKLDLIGRFINTKGIDKAEPKVKAKVSNLNKDLTEASNGRFKLIGRIEGIDEDIEKLSATKEINNDAEVDKLSNNIVKTEESIEENEALLITATENVTKFEKKVENFIESVKELEKDFNEEDYNITQDALDEISKEQRVVNRELKRIESVLGGAITCPKCETEFLLDADANLEELNKLFEEGFDSKKSLGEDFNETAELIEEMSVAKAKVTKLKREQSVLERELDALRRKVRSLQNGIEDNKRTVKLTEAKIETLLNEEGEDNTIKINALKLDKTGLESDIAKFDSRIENIENSIQEVSKWETHFKRFRMYLANMSLQTIQAKCNANLDKMGSDLLVRIDGFKVKANGDLKEEINAMVLRENERTFFSYSGGERGRLVFAMILSIQEIINEQNPYGGLQFLSVDEVFEGIDGVGLHHLMKSIENIGQSVLVTTHITDELLIDDDILTIEKINGISRLK